MVRTAIVSALGGIAGGLLAASLFMVFVGKADLLAFSGSLLGAAATIVAGYIALRGIREEMKEQADQFLATVASAEIERIDPAINALHGVVSLAERVLDEEKDSSHPWLAISRIFNATAIVAPRNSIDIYCRGAPLGYRDRMVEHFYNLNRTLYEHDENEKRYTFGQSYADRAVLNADGARLRSQAANHRAAIRDIASSARDEIASLEAEHSRLDAIKKRVLAAYLRSSKAGTDTQR